MGDQVKADLAVMADVSRKFSADYEQLAGHVNSLRSEVHALVTTWRGTASHAFQNTFGDVERAWHNLNLVLDEIASNIHVTRVKYQTVDEDSAGSYTAVQATSITSSLRG